MARLHTCPSCHVTVRCQLDDGSDRCRFCEAGEHDVDLLCRACLVKGPPAELVDAFDNAVGELRAARQRLSEPVN
jgi:hypothetical protein